MPVRRTRRRMGGSLSGFWNKTKDFLKKTKLLSTVGRTLAPLAGPYSGLANQALDYGESQGYGRRRIRRRRRIGGCSGGALRPAGARSCGGMMRPVGGARMSSRMSGVRMPPRMAMKF